MKKHYFRPGKGEERGISNFSLKIVNYYMRLSQ